MTRHRIVDEHPGSLESWAYPRQSLTTVGESLMRANVLSNANLFAESFRVSRGSLIDGIYACQLSADQTLLFTANRGQNHVTVYDYPSLTVRDRVVMPELGEIDGSLSDWADPRLGFHHSYLVSPDPLSGEH
jgi:hypothetical protein